MPDRDEQPEPVYRGPRPTATQRNTDRSIPAIQARWRQLTSMQPRSNLDYARIGEQARADVGPLLDELEKSSATIAAMSRELDAVYVLATAWANQPDDDGKDTEQQIADGRAILALLDGQPEANHG